jgi:FixJ family two-component response regulator
LCLQDRDNRSQCKEKAQIKTRLGKLTAREFEVLRHVIAGQLNKQIACKLDISEKTVKVHRARVIEKMAVHSVAELVRLTEKTGVRPIDLTTTKV